MSSNLATPTTFSPVTSISYGAFSFLSVVGFWILSVILRVMGREAVRKVGLTCSTAIKR